MSRTRQIAVVLLAVLVVANLLPAREARELSVSSFGETPSAHGALFELFVSLGLEPDRAMAPVERLPDGTIWWVEPAGVCDGRIAMEGEVDVLDAEAVQWAVGSWIEQGGVAVVLLEPEGTEVVRCDAILGAPLPPRTHLLPDELASELGEDDAADAANDPPDTADRVASGDHTRRAEAERDGAAGAADERVREADAVWDGRGHPAAGQEVVMAVVEGPWAAAAREIPAARVRAFGGEPEAGSGWQTVASIAAPGVAARPFALERPVGDGRVVVVADATFVRNQRLDLGDAAILAVDFTSAYGPPHFDERAHGFVAESNAARFLARSPAMPVFAGLALLGLLVLWRGTALPGRRLEDPEEDAPTLAGYLRSMASLYARSRDYPELAERYRELCESQVRRHFGLPPETPSTALAERIERSSRLSRERAARLTSRALLPVESEAALRVFAQDLDALVEEVIH